MFGDLFFFHYTIFFLSVCLFAQLFVI